MQRKSAVQCSVIYLQIWPKLDFTFQNLHLLFVKFEKEDDVSVSITREES